MLGVIPTREALSAAFAQGLDLVEVAPNADPPVCRIMDLGKYRYEQRRKERMARKHQHSATVKEVKFHCNVEQHDYDTKLRHIKEFLEKGHKVKLTLTFRGRENAHPDLGFQLIRRVIGDCAEFGSVSMEPMQMGRNILSMLAAKAGKGKARASTEEGELTARDNNASIPPPVSKDQGQG